MLRLMCCAAQLCSALLGFAQTRVALAFCDFLSRDLNNASHDNCVQIRQAQCSSGQKMPTLGVASLTQMASWEETISLLLKVFQRQRQQLTTATLAAKQARLAILVQQMGLHQQKIDLAIGQMTNMTISDQRSGGLEAMGLGRKSNADFVESMKFWFELMLAEDEVRPLLQQLMLCRLRMRTMSHTMHHLADQLSAMFDNGIEMITAFTDLLDEVPRKCEDCNFSDVNFNVLTARRCQNMMSLLNRMHSTDSSHGGLTLAGEEVAHEATDGEVKK